MAFLPAARHSTKISIATDGIIGQCATGVGGIPCNVCRSNYTRHPILLSGRSSLVAAWSNQFDVIAMTIDLIVRLIPTIRAPLKGFNARVRELESYECAVARNGRP